MKIFMVLFFYGSFFKVQGDQAASSSGSFIVWAWLVEASAAAGRAGWCEDTCDDSVLASENSVVAGVAASTMRELDVAVAAARGGENNCNGHLLSRVIRCIVSTLLIRSFVIHPCMRLLLPVRCVLRVLVWLGSGVLSW